MKVSVNWLKDYVTIRPPIESVAERLTMAGLEVKSVRPDESGRDTLFEIEITSNRPDWLSHLGVARELSAVENLPFKLPELTAEESRQMPAGWKVQLKDLEACPFYSGVLVEGIEMNPTPDFMKERLQACGMRSINLIVDITNYVLLETGQPLHAFDADLLKGKEIQIRRARPKETMTAIDGKKLELKGDDLVIADAEAPVALAGVMGGQETEVGNRTRVILLEAAIFNPGVVRQSARRHGLSTESSYRFERRVDPAGVELARKRALYLIKRYAKPRFISAALKSGGVPVSRVSKIHLTAQEIKRVLGAEIKPSAVASSLTRLGMEVKPRGQNAWEVSIPSFRFDLNGPEDLIEEIARIYGYDQIPSGLPERAPIDFEPDPRRRTEALTRNYLSGCGLFETVTFSLISDKGVPAELLQNAVVIQNPQHRELCWMRPTLISSLLQVIRRNYDQGAAGVPIFEIANAYRMNPDEKKPVEERQVCLALSGVFKEKNWLDAERQATCFDLKGILESWFESLHMAPPALMECEHPFFEPGASLKIKAGGETIGVLGAVRLPFLEAAGLEEYPVYAAEVSLEKMTRLMNPVPRFEELPKFPSMKRDLSVTVEDAVHAAEIMELAGQLGGDLVKKVEVFDLFRGGRIPKGQKNIGIRVTYQSPERTLVSEEIQEIHSRVAAGIVQRFQAAFQ